MAMSKTMAEILVIAEISVLVGKALSPEGNTHVFISLGGTTH